MPVCWSTIFISLSIVFIAGEKVYAVICHISDALLAAEAKLNELDNLVGDGDCGTTLSRGATGVKSFLVSNW